MLLAAIDDGSPFHPPPTVNLTPFPDPASINTPNVTSSSVGDDHDLSLSLTAGHVVLIIILASIIVGIFIGNVFVVLSVALFCKMRTLSNGLIASLASADLLVSVLVLPISLQYEVMGRWTLGPYICDFWITSDVFCCTASILNIVVIALDRYWLITRNVRYTHSTVFPRRKVCATMLGIAWSVSGLISCSPLFGWRTGNEKQDPGVCMISQDYGYTIFSTFSSFWIPLSVILVVYFKIFLFARQRVIRKKRQYRSTRIGGSSSPGAGRGVIAGPGGRGVHPPRHQSADSLSPSESTVFQIRSRFQDPGTPDQVHITELSETVIASHFGGTTECPSRGTPRDDSEMGGDGDVVSDEAYGDLVFNGGCSRVPDSDDPFTVAPASTTSGANGISGSAGSNHRTLGTGRRYNFRATLTVSISRTQKSHTRRIRRSARTLGLIIGGFLFCWLPFFLVATIAPFGGSDAVPPVVGSLVLWLGYSNSLLNPAIYAIWEKTFRKSFRRLSTCDIK